MPRSPYVLLGTDDGRIVASHVVRVVLLYAAYEACQVAFSDWFYLGQRPLPKTLPLCVFGVALGWEYATMVYVRSAPSIAYLPKLTLLYFLAAHGTFYALARPYALLNLAVAALLMAHAVLYVILEFELPAHARGDVDHETPRARHTELPWPALDAMLPPTWSLFMPLVPDDATVDPKYYDALAAQYPAVAAACHTSHSGDPENPVPTTHLLPNLGWTYDDGSPMVEGNSWFKVCQWRALAELPAFCAGGWAPAPPTSPGPPATTPDASWPRIIGWSTT